MSHIRRRKNGSWQVIIRKKNYPDIVRTFLEKGTASKWSKLIETQMDQKVFQDMSGAESTTLSQLVIKYRDEIVPELKSSRVHTYKLNKLLKNKICYYNLLQLNSSNVYQYKQSLQKEGLAPKTKCHGSGLKTFLGKCRLGDKGDKSGQVTKYWARLPEPVCLIKLPRSNFR